MIGITAVSGLWYATAHLPAVAAAAEPLLRSAGAGMLGEQQINGPSARFAVMINAGDTGGSWILRRD